MSTLKYFFQCTTKQEVKQTFRKLAKEFHPDTNTEDTNEIMKEIIAEYESIIKNIPSVPSDNSAQDNMSETEFSAYVTAEMKEVIDNISHLPITIEIIGSWIWVSGENTYAYKSYLTAYNFTWCAKKKMYSWHIGQYRKFGKTKDIDDIRATYGTTKVNNKYRAAIG